MDNTFRSVLIFASGVAVGVFSTWKYLNKKYFLTEYKELNEEPSGNKNKIEERPVEAKKGEYEDAMKKYGADEEQAESNMPEPLADRPYIISEAELGENGHDVVSLTYFEDGVIADDYDEQIEDAESIIGHEVFEIFERDDLLNVVCIRDERRNCDYEITRDGGTYEELTDKRPYLKRRD